MKGLTEKQRGILEFIEDFMDANIMAPTVYEIAEHFRIKTSTVFAHLRALQKKNQLTRSSKARSISLNKPRQKTRKPNGVCAIPLLERNGEKSGKEIYYDYSAVKTTVNPRKLFAIRIPNGDFGKAGILSGDVAILKKTASPLNDGDIVMTEAGGIPSLRIFRRTGNDSFELVSGNNPSETIRGSGTEIPVSGVLIGVQRSF